MHYSLSGDIILQNKPHRNGINMKYASKDYMVNELARFYGVSGDTIRHYDRKGILPSRKKEDNNYRIYGRDDLMAMDYIMRLRKLDTPLEDINSIVNHFSYRETEEYFRQREESLCSQIENLMRVRTMISDYRQTLLEAREGGRGMSIREMPAIICKRVTSSAWETLEKFDSLPQSLLPLLTITMPESDFMAEDFPNILLDAEVRSDISEFSFTAMDRRGAHHSPSFPTSEFEIIPAGKCLYFSEELELHSDYSVMYRMAQYIKDHGLEVKTTPLVRIINTRIQGNADTYEYIVPLK